MIGLNRRDLRPFRAGLALKLNISVHQDHCISIEGVPVDTPLGELAFEQENNSDECPLSPHVGEACSTAIGHIDSKARKIWHWRIRHRLYWDRQRSHSSALQHIRLIVSSMCFHTQQRLQLLPMVLIKTMEKDC